MRNNDKQEYTSCLLLYYNHNKILFKENQLPVIDISSKITNKPDISHTLSKNISVL